MYIFTAIAFSIGRPWRKPFFTNIFFMIAFVLVLIYSILILAAPVTRFSQFYIVNMEDMRMNGFILGLGLGFGLTVFVLQKFVW
jgi:hypothetical protein